jgi:hypothetical protein
VLNALLNAGLWDERSAPSETGPGHRRPPRLGLSGQAMPER